MKMFLKRTVGAVSALTAAVTLIALNAPKNINAASETISGGHSHVMCGNLVHDNCTHENIEFEPFPENNEILRGKSYYLTKDIVLDKQTRIFIEQGTTNICLNGYSIKKEGGQIIDINSIQGQGAVLNICDCDSRTGVSGKIINTSDDSEYACISVIDQSEFNLYGGIVDGGANGIGIEVEKISHGVSQGGSANIYGGTVQTQYNCALWIDDSDTSLSVFGGKIKSDGYNAVVVTGERSNVLICGGEVIGSAADCETIYIYGEETAVTINGGSVTGENYGAAYCVYGTLNITGGEVKSESYKGSTIYNEDTLVLSGGTVSCSGYYGITNFGGGKTTISGGELKSDGSAINNLANSEVEIDGGDISSEDYSGIYNKGSLIIEDGSITCNGTYAIQNYENADLNISGGTIEAGSYLLYNLSGALADISDGTLMGVKPCLWNNGSLNISNGKIMSDSYNPVVNNGILSISGGSYGTEDSENEKYIQNKGILNLSGSPVFNNTSLWLSSDDNINITGEITYNTPCKVYIDSSVPRIFTNGWSTYMGEKNPSDYFESPYNLRIVGQIDGEAVLRPFMITFNTNGGTCESASTFADDDGHALLLSEASRKGYIFDGWFTAEENGEKVTYNTVFTGDAEVYAHWSDCSHTWGDTHESDSLQHWKVCTICDAENVKIKHREVIDAEVEATCTADGKTEGSHCSVCDMVLVEQKTVPAMGHTAATDPAVAPTCTEEGKTEGSQCSVCDMVLVEQETVPATGHTAATDPAVAPTCTEEGKTEGSHCSVCDTVLVEQQAIPAAGHSFGDWQSDNESHWMECENCGIRENEAKHQWDNGTVITPPIDDDDGEILFNCLICGETKTTVIPAVGENPTDPTKPNEPADPTDPIDPADPTDPADPIDPTDPTDPTDPETPDDNDNGSISKDALSGENAPSAELDTPLDELIEAVLTSEEQELIKNGIDIKIILTVEDETEYVSDEDKTIVEAAMNGISGCKLGQYLDVNLLKIIGDKQEHITETKGLITVTLEIPKTLLGEGRKYSIIRIHDGEASVLLDLDNDDSTITFQSDKFSTYALVYSEGKAESPAQSEGNPITGTVITLIPFTMAAALAAVLGKRRNK